MKINRIFTLSRIIFLASLLSIATGLSDIIKVQLVDIIFIYVGLFAGITSSIASYLSSKSPLISELEIVNGWFDRPVNFNSSKINFTALGVHRSEYPVNEEPQGYIKRDVIDENIEAAVNGDKPIVLVRGTHLSGTTRSLAKAAIENEKFSRYKVLKFKQCDSRKLSDMLDACTSHTWVLNPKKAVLWIENITDDHLKEINKRFSEDLKSSGLRIFATQQINDPLEVHTYPADIEQVILENAEQTTVRSNISQKEVADIKKVYPHMRERLENEKHYPPIGMLMVELIDLRKAYSGLKDTGEYGTLAVVRIAADWDGIGMPVKLDSKAISALYEPYLHDLEKKINGPATKEEIADSIDRALKSGLIRSNVQTDNKNHDYYFSHPLFSVLINPKISLSKIYGWDTPEQIWKYAIKNLKDDDLLVLGVDQFHKGNLVRSSEVLQKFSPGKLDVNICDKIARHFYMSNRLDIARFWMKKLLNNSSQTFVLGVEADLGSLENMDGNYKEAERYWSIIANSTDKYYSSLGFLNLGLLYQGCGDRSIRDLDKAIDSLKKVLTTKNENESEASYHIYRIYNIKNNRKMTQYWYKKAEEALLEDIEQYKNTLNIGRLYYLLAGLHTDEDKLNTAINELESGLSALESLPPDKDYRRKIDMKININIELASIYNGPKYKDYKKVLRLYNECIEDLKKNRIYLLPNQLYEMAILSASNSYTVDDTEMWCKLVIEAKDFDYTPRSHLYLGDIYSQKAVDNKKYLSDAISNYKDAIKYENPNISPVAMVRLAKVKYFMPNELDETIALLKQTLESSNIDAAKEARNFIFEQNTLRDHEHFEYLKYKTRSKYMKNTATIVKKGD